MSGRPRKGKVHWRSLWDVIKPDVLKVIAKDWPQFKTVPDDELKALLDVARNPGLARSPELVRPFLRLFENAPDFTLAVLAAMRSLTDPDRLKGRQRIRVFFATHDHFHDANGKLLKVWETPDEDLAAAIRHGKGWKHVGAETIRKVRKEFRTKPRKFVR